MLINEDDFLKIINVSGSFDFDKITTQIRSIERELKKTYLGAAIYDELDDAYAAEPTDNQQNLLDLIHPVIGHLAMWKAADLLNIDITDKGFQASHSSDKKPAFDWQVRNAKAALRRTGYAALEELLTYLEENQDTYPNWELSLASDNNRDLIINSAKEFNEVITCDRNLFVMLRPFQKHVLRSVIKPLLGADLYAYLMENIRTDAFDPDILVLMEDLKIITAHYTYADALSELPILVDEEGVHFLNSAFSGNFTGKEPAASSIISNSISNHQRKAQSAVETLICFLNENVADYPLFETSSNYEDPAAEEEETDDDYDESTSGIVSL